MRRYQSESGGKEEDYIQLRLQALSLQTFPRTHCYPWNNLSERVRSPAILGNQILALVIIVVMIRPHYWLLSATLYIPLVDA